MPNPDLCCTLNTRTLLRFTRMQRMPAKKGKGSVPRYESFRPRSPAASRVGAGNRRQDTTPEILLRKALWATGVRYRLHPTALPGRPDLVIVRHRVAVFCDGDFWHGRDWQVRKNKLAAGWNASYWVAKIERNRQRDKSVASQLKQLGWRVIRVWESDVRHDATSSAAKILRFVNKTRSSGARRSRLA